jgi:antagonist of KipI
MSLRVLEPGLYTLVVDFGRPSQRSLGVPVGGAADRTSLALGNALVGNPPDAAALEISLAGPTLEAGCDLACVVYGAPFTLTCGVRSLEAGRTFTLHAGEILRIGGAPEGMRAYLCIKGGVQGPVILGSRSALGPVKAGDVLCCEPGKIAVKFVQIQWEWDAARGPTESSGTSVNGLRVLPGPQADWFPRGALYRAGGDGQVPEFVVSPKSNRMGLRLEGEALAVPARELLSEPVCPGTVQVTRDGQLVIIGVDGQTIGGYPKLAQVVTADIDRLGQLRPGDRLGFIPIDWKEAELLYRTKMAELRRWLTRLRLAEDDAPSIS